MVLVRGLDRLDGSAIDGMPDELWSEHTAEMLASQPEGAPFSEHCARYADGTDLSAQTPASQSPLLLIFLAQPKESFFLAEGLAASLSGCLALRLSLSLCLSLCASLSL